MAHLKYYSYKGFGEMMTEKLRYSQAVRIGDRIEIAGQGKHPETPHLLQQFIDQYPGGVDPNTFEFHKTVAEQIDQTFANIDLTLKDAGGKGWSQVYRVTSYHVPLNDEALAAMVRNFEKWMPGHRPIWSAYGIAQLGVPEGVVEIEVAAHDPEGSK